MAEKENSKKSLDKQEITANNGCPLFVSCGNKKAETIVCEVCGHVNPEKTAICKNCSNYLI